MYGFGGLPRNTLADVQVFNAATTTSGVGWQVWRRRPGATMVSIFGLGGGGGGGNGVVGANSTAAGGGGGGAAAQSSVTIPAIMLPESLFVSVGFGGAASASGVSTRVAISSTVVANDCILLANAGGLGGNAAGATGGTAGSSGGVAAATTMILGFAGQTQVYSGMLGIAGGATVSGSALTLPTTGIRVTGGTGGGGLPAAATGGTAGGAFTVAGSFPAQIGGIGGSAVTTPPTGGSNGYTALPRYTYFYGGTGGGSTHGSATGAGLVGANGGNGGNGCGGGGGGGALTGSTQGLGGRGGDGLVIIVQW